MNGRGSDKSGTFEWIASYSDIQRHLNSALSSCGPVVVIIGNGTSDLAEKMASDHPSLVIYATDNDADCVNHMRALYNGSRVVYAMVDIVEDPVERLLSITQTPIDIIVDKGTLDAILVEGSIAQMLYNVANSLKEGGLYCIFSFHNTDYLASLLNCASLTGLIIEEAAEIDSGVYYMRLRKVSVALSQGVFDLEGFSAHEFIFLEETYKNEQPLLTEDEIERLTQQFQAYDRDGNGLPISTAHTIMFDQSLGYDMTLFAEDLRGFPLIHTDRITLEEAIDFIKMMQ